MSTFKEVFLREGEKPSIVKKDSPFDKLGYKEDDYFVVISDSSEFLKGCIVKLNLDDNSRAPAFDLVSGKQNGEDNWDYVNLDDLVKLI